MNALELQHTATDTKKILMEEDVKMVQIGLYIYIYNI